MSSQASITNRPPTGNPMLDKITKKLRKKVKKQREVSALTVDQLIYQPDDPESPVDVCIAELINYHDLKVPLVKLPTAA